MVLSAAAPGEAAEALRRELDILAERAGLAIPPERREALLAEFTELKRLLAVLHAHPTEAEPAAGFFLARVIEADATS